MSPSPDHVKSLAGRIFTTVLAFSLGILLAFSAVMVSIFYYSYEHDAEQALVQEASRAAASLDEAPAADVTTVLSQQFSGITRYTLIGESGLVLYDSQADAGQMDNHASRPEVSKAARTGEAVSMRYSETLGTDTVYAAEKLSDGRILSACLKPVIPCSPSWARCSCPRCSRSWSSPDWCSCCPGCSRATS